MKVLVFFTTLIYTSIYASLALAEASSATVELTDSVMAQKFVAEYKLYVDDQTPNNCSSVNSTGRYRFYFINPYYSDSYRAHNQIEAEANGLILNFEKKVNGPNLQMIKEGLDWVPAFDRPSFRGLNDSGIKGQLPDLNIADSSRIFASTVNEGEIVVSQQINQRSTTGAQVHLQMATLSVKLGVTASERPGYVVPDLRLTVTKFVKYQYFIIKYGPTGLLEQIDTVDECVFKRI